MQTLLGESLWVITAGGDSTGGTDLNKQKKKKLNQL